MPGSEGSDVAVFPYTPMWCLQVGPMCFIFAYLYIYMYIIRVRTVQLSSTTPYVGHCFGDLENLFVMGFLSFL